MESKEAALNSTAEVSPGSHVSSSSPIENDVLSSKNVDMNENNDDNIRNDSKVVVSEDEGYVGGNEVLQAATDKSIPAEIDGVGVEEGNSDVLVKDENGGDDVEMKDVEVDDDVAAKGFEGGLDADGGNREGEGEISKSDEKLAVFSDEGGGEIVDDGEKGVVEEVEVKSKELEEEEEIKLSEPAAIEQGDIEDTDSNDVKSIPEEDSVVESIEVDVNVASPGIVVVGELEENIDAVSKSDEEVVAEVDVVENREGGVEGIDGDGDFADSVAKLVVNSDEGGAEVESNKIEQEEVKFTQEGDSVVDSINVDVVDSGVIVVGETKENGGTGKGEVSLESAGIATENGEDENTVANAEPKSLEIENDDVGNEKVESSVDGGVTHLENGVEKSTTDNDFVDGDMENGEVRVVDEVVALERESNQLDISNVETLKSDDDQTALHTQTNGLVDGISEEPKELPDVQEIREVEDSMSEGENDEMIFGGSEAAKKFIEDLERESGAGLDTPLEQSQIDGQIVDDSEDEEGETDDEGDGKQLFDSAALAALLKAATGSDPSGGSVTFTSQDGSRLFSMERPAGLGSSLSRPAARPTRPSLFSTLASSGGGESEENLSEEEKKKLEKLQNIRVKFLRLVHRLGLSPEESVAAQVLYQLALLGGRKGSQTFSLDAAKRTALQLEEAVNSNSNDDLDFSVNILVIGKSGVGKSATINSLFGEDKASIDAFGTGTISAREIHGSVNGVKIRVIDTPGLKSSVMEQGENRSILSSVNKFTRKSPTDVVLYVDRLDAQSRDLNDLPLLKTVTSSLSNSIWRSAIVTLTHGASAPPDGASGSPLSYEIYISQRSRVVQQSIGHAVGDLRMMSPSLMSPVTLVENHPSCRKNREGEKILPNGQSWRPQLLLLCYSMKILAEANSLSKPQEPFDHRRLFGFRSRPAPLPYMLQSMLQSRPHPKLASDQGGEGGDSDIDLDEFSDDDEEEDEYDQLPPFKPLRKAQLAKLSKEQRKAYFEEFDYRVKLLQRKQWREELRRMREMKKRGKDGGVVTDYGFAEEEDPESGGGAAPVAVPLPDMTLPPSFDADNPAFRYRFLEPTSQFLARPVSDSHGWDHDCGYDGVNVEHSLAIANRLAAAYTVQLRKDKKDFSFSLDSSVAAKQGENNSLMAGFDVQSIGKQFAYIIRAEAKTKSLKRNKATGGLSFTFLGENVVPGIKIEDQITIGKQYALVGSAGAVRSNQDTAYGANIEMQRREADYPIGQVQSTVGLSMIKWRGDLNVMLNSLAQFSLGRNSKVAIRAGINNKLSGQITVKTSSSEHLSLALAAVLPAALSIYNKLHHGGGDNYQIY